MRALTRTVLMVAATLPSALLSQGVIVQSNTDALFFGGLGTLVSFASRMGGGDMNHNQSTTSISGHKMRVESPTTATILDADGGRITNIDLKQKTYTTMTFAEMAAAMQQATQSAQQSAQQNAQQAKADQGKKSKDPNAPQGDMNVKYHVVVDRPGQHDKVAGYDAERVFITVTLEGEVTPEGEKTQQVGSMVFLLDEWMSKDAPQIAAMQEFQRANSQAMGQAFRAQAGGLQTVFASDPRIKDGFTAAAKEVAKIPGISLRSVTYVTLVPAGMTFDRKLALGDASAAAAADSAAKKDAKPSGGGFRGLMGALKSAADDANKKSADKSGDKNAPAPPPAQITMMSLTDQVTSITKGSVPSSTFEVPAGYRQIQMRTLPPGT